MTTNLSMLLWLVVVWVALWERLSVANVLSGALCASVLLALFPLRPGPRRGRLRPVRALHFLAYFLVKLAHANLVVAWEVVTPQNNINEGIVAVPITRASDGLVTLVANAISLTPGTLTVDVDNDPCTLYVHVLHLRSIEQVRVDVNRLEWYALRAFGGDDAVAVAERRLRTLERRAVVVAPEREAV